MARNYFIAGNWKMNKTPAEAVAFAKELKEALSALPYRYMVAPTFVCLSEVRKVLEGSNILLGAQNINDNERGAFTGEISAESLKDLGVDVIIIGHSERRTLYNESDELINNKVKLSLEYGFEVILCVGETLQERENGTLWDVIKNQTVKGLSGISIEQLKNITIAYEPVWAIGTGKTATPEDAQEVHAFIRKELTNLYNEASAKAVFIQYGGSVNPKNVSLLMAKNDIDGALVGGAALKLEDFTTIAKIN